MLADYLSSWTMMRTTTPMLLVLGVSLLFDTHSRMQLRYSNMISCILLGTVFFLAARIDDELRQTALAAKLGLGASISFTLALPLRAMYTQRIMAPRTHYCIGAFYTTYYAAQWLRDAYYVEDAMEDTDDDASL